MPTFQDLRLLPSLVAPLAEQGLTKPTAVQSRSVSPLLEGRPVVAVSATGSGKTLAYVLPLLHTRKEHEKSEHSRIRFESRQQRLEQAEAEKEKERKKEQDRGRRRRMLFVMRRSCAVPASAAACPSPPGPRRSAGASSPSRPAPRAGRACVSGGRRREAV